MNFANFGTPICETILSSEVINSVCILMLKIVSPLSLINWKYVESISFNKTSFKTSVDNTTSVGLAEKFKFQIIFSVYESPNIDNEK